MELFSLKDKNALEKSIHEIHFIKYSHYSLPTINDIISRISISLPREDTYICSQNSYKHLDFDVVKNDDTRYTDSDEKALVNFGPVASFSEAKLTTSSDKHLGKVDKLHIISIMHKLLTSQRQTSELMVGVEESVTIRKQELTNKRTEKKNILCEHQAN